MRSFFIEGLGLRVGVRVWVSSCASRVSGLGSGPDDLGMGHRKTQTKNKENKSKKKRGPEGSGNGT